MSRGDQNEAVLSQRRPSGLRIGEAKRFVRRAL
jgi:hypothetical protein